MRRLTFLICAVVLLLDLADDGCLGKVKFVAPQHAAKCSVDSSGHNSGKVHSPGALSPEHLQEFRYDFDGQMASVRVVPSFKINDFYLFGSSGGIPL